MTQAVEEFSSAPENMKRLIDLNNMGIPPAFAFIFITQNDNKKHFEKLLNEDLEYHQFFGKLFATLFYGIGYKPSCTYHNNVAYLKSASVFGK